MREYAGPRAGRPWAATLGRLPAGLACRHGVLVVILGTVGGGRFAELTVAVAPSAVGLLPSALLFTGLGALGPAMFMSAFVEATAARGHAFARVAFWLVTAASLLPAILFMVAGSRLPTVPVGVVAGTLAGVFVGILIAWTAWVAAAWEEFEAPRGPWTDAIDVVDFHRKK